MHILFSANIGVSIFIQLTYNCIGYNSFRTEKLDLIIQIKFNLFQIGPNSNQVILIYS